MKLTVKNFGPIREAKNIGINPMTIFVGPSNTGKSYLAMLIYSIFKVITDEEFIWELGIQIRGESKDFQNSFDKAGKPRYSVLEDIENSFSHWARAVSDAWRYQFDYYFGEDGRKMLSRQDDSGGFSVMISDKENQLRLNLTSPEKSNLTSRKKQKIYECVKLRLLDRIEEVSGRGNSGQARAGFAICISDLETISCQHS